MMLSIRCPYVQGREKCKESLLSARRNPRKSPELRERGVSTEENGAQRVEEKKLRLNSLPHRI